MKSIISIIKEAGLELTADQEQAITKATVENYKAIADYDKVKTARDGLQSQLEELKGNLAKFDGINVDALKQQIADAQKKAADAEAAFQKQIADRDYSDAIRNYTSGLRFSSKSAEKAFTAALKEKGLKLENGKLLGADDFLTTYKEEDAGAFASEESEKKARFTAPAGQTGGADDADADFLQKMRKAAGLID